MKPRNGESWTPEERELFMKLNRDFAEKLSDKVKKLPAL